MCRTTLRRVGGAIRRPQVTLCFPGKTPKTMGVCWEDSMLAARFAAAVAALLLVTAARADYPDHPIRLVVPQAPGSATDTVARILAAELGKEIGQQIIVDNRPGGALTVGIDVTAKSDPDGYTICVGPIGALAITRHMVAKLPYDIERDL